jgi:tetratricopeptide (TPR) repeat protein
MTSAILAAALLLAPAQYPNVDVPVLSAPTKTAATPTAAEMASLQTGYHLFQQQKFDEAIAEYQKVLSANPASAAAMNEIAIALLHKKDVEGAIAMAMKATDYAGPEISKSYALIGTVFDVIDEPKKAIAIYDQAVALAPAHSGTLYYNKAVTQMQSLKDVKAAIETLKQGEVAEPRHASTQLLLGKYFMSADMQTPAFMAFSRFLIAEPSTRRTGEGFQPWYGLLTQTVKVGADGKAQLKVNPNKSKDEGDLLQMDMFFGLSQIDAGAMPANATPGERLTAQVTRLINVWSTVDPKKDATKFLWTYYLPYFKELRDKKFVQPFVYHVCQNGGVKDAREWIAAHRTDVQEFLEWDKAFVFKPARDGM